MRAGYSDSNDYSGHDDCEECSTFAGCEAFEEFADSPGCDDKAGVADYFTFADKTGHADSPDYFDCRAWFRLLCPAATADKSDTIEKPMQSRITPTTAISRFCILSFPVSLSVSPYETTIHHS